MDWRYVAQVVECLSSNSSSTKGEKQNKTKKQKKLFKKKNWVLVAHACNPSYSGDGDQDD
jgi:hypothetical protein